MKTVKFSPLIFVAVLSLLATFFTLSVSRAHAATNTLNDCSDRINFPADFTTQFKNAVFANDGTTVTSTWKIVVGMDSLNPKLLFVTGTPMVAQQNLKISNTTAAPWEVKLDMTSANGNLYRLYYDPHYSNGVGAWGSISKFAPADNYVRSLSLYCGFINQRADYAAAQSGVFVSARSPVAQQVDLGFLPPLTTSGGSGGTTGGITKAELETVLVKFFSVFVTLFIGLSLIKLLRYPIR